MEESENLSCDESKEQLLQATQEKTFEKKASMRVKQ